MSGDTVRPARFRHGAILGLDLEGFARPDRNDPDRVRLRGALQQEVVRHAIATVTEPERCRYSDTGDGLFIIFPSDIDKAELISRLIPTLEQSLLEHNRASSRHMRMRVRLVLHFHEIAVDQQPLTGSGLVSSGLNIADRLLNSELLRSMLRSSPERFPLVLLLSDVFYEQIIRGHLAIFEHDYERHEVQTKDQILVAWLWRPPRAPMAPRQEESLASKEASTVLASGVAADRGGPLHSQSKRPLTLADLPQTCIYVPTTDVHNHGLYAMFAGQVPLRNHVETALLLGRHTIVHCADPYRSVEVCDILTDFRPFIEDSSLLFLLGSSIQDVRRDFLPYLHRKAQQYIASGHGLADVTSLSPGFDSADFDERVLDLIDSSPVLLHRGYRGTARFVEAVRKDLTRSETMVAYDHQLSKLRRLNLTLFQILHLEHAMRDGRVVRTLATDDVFHQLIDELEVHLARASFSRQILLSVIQDHLGEALPTTSSYYRLLAARISLLHLQINVGSHGFIECTPGRDGDSPYFYGHLLTHVGVLSGLATRERFGVSLVARLRALPEWPQFVNYHLRVMADLYARRLGDLPVNFDERFADSKHHREFAPIAIEVRDSWT
jgi:hypothetical protein